MKENMTSDEYIKTMHKLGVNLPRSVVIMGTEYTFLYTTAECDPELEGLIGLCDSILKVIKIEQAVFQDNHKDNTDRFALAIFSVIRHEIIHAFFYECGLDGESEYAQNEELIDWIALKIPQITKTMQNIGVLESR